MIKPAHNKNFAESHDIGQGRLMQSRDSVENDLNSRLNKVRGSIDKLGSVAYYVWLKNSIQVCDRVQNLRVKIEVVCWMIRIVKHLNGVTREMVISAIDKSLDDLARFVVAEMNAKNVVRAA